MEKGRQWTPNMISDTLDILVEFGMIGVCPDWDCTKVHCTCSEWWTKVNPIYDHSPKKLYQMQKLLQERGCPLFS